MIVRKLLEADLLKSYSSGDDVTQSRRVKRTNLMIWIWPFMSAGSASDEAARRREKGMALVLGASKERLGQLLALRES
ncbi:hypothetical protein CFP56_006578 [Quercus suber]|uniref:Uncharacterized protein n=1 Tax=Quercus suber TaxID=58331 RepID=A0AAW0L9I7_QUESU